MRKNAYFCVFKTVLRFIISKTEQKFNVFFLNILFFRFFDVRIISLDLLFVNKNEKINIQKILSRKSDVLVIFYENVVEIFFFDDRWKNFENIDVDLLTFLGKFFIMKFGRIKIAARQINGGLYEKKEEG